MDRKVRWCDWCGEKEVGKADFCSNECRDTFHNAGGNAKLPGNPKTGTVHVCACID